MSSIRSRKGHGVALAVCALALAATAACGSTSDASSGTASSESTASVPASSAPSGDSPTKAPSASSAAKVVITIRDFEFQTPGSVPAGAEITVKNEDSASHTVTASGQGGFDVVIEGKSSATFTAPEKSGTYPYICRFHGNMMGTLTVA